MATTPSQRGLGFPAVSEPRSFDLRSVQTTVQQVRERLRVIDAAVSTLQNVTASNQLTTTVAQLQQQANQLQIRLTALENSLGADDTTTLIADTDMPAGAPVVPSGVTSCRMVDPNDPEAVFSCVGLVTEAVVQGQAAVIQRRGSFSLPGSGFEAGRAVYASIGGDLTQQPTYGAAAVPVGIATGEGTVYVTTGSPALLALGLDDNAYERFMNASVELVSDAVALAAQVDAAANGLVTKTADGLVTTRVLQGTTNRTTVTNGDGVAGNPTVDISASYVGQATIDTVGTIVEGTWEGDTVDAAHGGTGQSTYAVGDLLYASSATALSKLPDVAVGSVLLSGGVATAPEWGQVDLATHVDGVLPIANGGTGSSDANDALNALLPDQTGHAGEALVTDGTDASWQPMSGGSTSPRKIAVFSTLRV